MSGRSVTQVTMGSSRPHVDARRTNQNEGLAQSLFDQLGTQGTNVGNLN